MLFIGIDPGLQGAVAVLGLDGSKEVYPMPAGKNFPEPLLMVDLLKMITYGKKFAVAIERIQYRPGQGIVAAGNYSFGAGVIHGCLHCLSPVEIHIINPQVWQKWIWSHYGTHGDDTKQKTYQAMLAGHPDMAAKFTTLRGRLLDGNSDATGIATWLWHNSYASKRVP
jgi:hypothetical protein